MSGSIGRAALRLCLSVGLAAAAFRAEALELPAYSDAVLAKWQQRYPPGILSNVRGVILPRLAPAERERLDGVRFEFPRVLEDFEPFGFAADSRTGTIYMSVNSLKFLDDAAIAAAWLNRNGYTLESLTDYFLLLRAWPGGGDPPALLEALCVPPEALDDKDVDSLAQKIFATGIVFVMLHEMGHVLHRDTGYDDVSRAEARRREAAADAFALDMLARIGDPPLGIVNLFLAMTYLTGSGADFGSDGDPEHLAQRTHPLTPDRLAAFADGLQRDAASYLGSGLSRADIAGVALQIRFVAQTLATIGPLVALRAPSVRADRLGPRRAGDTVGRACGAAAAAAAPFSGRFRGTTVIDDVEFDLEAEFARDGSRVTGRSNYGIGDSVIVGELDGDTLHYRWSLGGWTGRGVLRHEDGRYVGEWVNDDPSLGSGPIELRPE